MSKGAGGTSGSAGSRETCREVRRYRRRVLVAAAAAPGVGEPAGKADGVIGDNWRHQRQHWKVLEIRSAPAAALEPADGAGRGRLRRRRDHCAGKVAS